MKILMVAAEMAPWAKVGGLADVIGSLPQALGRLGVQVHLCLPRYRMIKKRERKVALNRGVTVHLIDHPHYFKRKAVYGPHTLGYRNNLDRFSFFCRESLRRAQQEKIRPDLLHAHDWHAALSVVYLEKVLKPMGFFPKTRSVLSVHNLAYQGIYPSRQFDRLELPEALYSDAGVLSKQKVNLLKGGLLFAKQVTTVSPTYAREIQHPAQGAGFHRLLKKRSRSLRGILNGIDTAVWDPARDTNLPVRFDLKHMELKARDKEKLQRELGLPVDSEAFLIGLVTRLVSQKGLDLLVKAWPELKALNVQLAILGMGEPGVEGRLKRLAAKSNQVQVRLLFNDPLARRIYGGSDAFLMPSRYEPCGLGQMIAMRYGTVPIVRRTGGLADTVLDADASARGNGFSFTGFTPQALAAAVRRSRRAFDQKDFWNRLQRRGMLSDFSWDRSAQTYLSMYERLVK